MNPQRQKEEMEKLSRSIAPAVQQMNAIFDNPSLRRSMEQVISAQKHVMQVYESPAIKAAFKQHFVAQEQIKKLYESINLTGINSYGAFLKNTVYDKGGIVDLGLVTRPILHEVELSIPIVEEIIRKEPNGELAPIVKEVKKEIKKKRKKEKKIEVYFNSAELWHRNEEGEKQIVPFRSKQFHQLLQIFAVKGDFTKSEDLNREVKYSDLSAFSNAIGTLNKKFKSLGFDEFDAFEGKQSYGYRPHQSLFLIERRSE